MAFEKKTWKDRIVQHFNRRRLSEVSLGVYDVSREEGVVSQEGDAFSAANMNDLENRIEAGIQENEISLLNHKGRMDNPHGVSKSQVGLANVDNTSDANKPISTATQTALNNKADKVDIKFIEKDGGYVVDNGSTGRGTIGQQAVDLAYATQSYKGATGIRATAMGNNTEASGHSATAMGDSTEAIGHSATAMGENTTASGYAATAMGDSTEASGHSATAMGDSTEAIGNFTTAMGYNTEASGDYSTAMGNNTTASGYAATAMGYNTEANVTAATTMGYYNKPLNGSAEFLDLTADAFVLGNGDWENPSNAFRVTFDGKTYGMAEFNSTGADYAEYFEWLDGNPENEDRVGYFVTLDGDKIRKATSEDDYILGIVSANPSVIGDSHQDDWHGKYERDDWGRIQHHYVDVPAELDDEGVEIRPARQDYVAKLNPDWDNETEYIPREKRKEWSAVGMMGKLLVRDDGSCVVNGYCKPNDSGIAVVADEGYRVMKRVREDIVQILIKGG